MPPTSRHTCRRPCAKPLEDLLDENFPLALYRRLTADGEDVEHIITLGWRGASDQRIRDRLVEKHLLFLTQDEDFLFDEPTEALWSCRAFGKRDAWRTASKSGVARFWISRRTRGRSGGSS
jgi:hypothetical protein